ncbi:MAG: hypothetical protein K6F37_05000, partial [Lachnospiraceae bacterium]|nr:hypothetical protein [Lachnospiraceae bacterium]
SYYLQQGEKIYVTRYNDQMLKLVGAKGRLKDEFSRIDEWVHPDDKKLFYELLDIAYEDGINGSEGVIRFQISNGRMAMFYLRIYRINTENDSREFYVSYRDITKTKHLEQRMRFLSTYIRSTIILTEEAESGVKHEVLLNGMGRKLGITSEALGRELNNGKFFERMLNRDKGFLENIAKIRKGLVNNVETDVDILTDGGKVFSVHVNTEFAYSEDDNKMFVTEMYEK